MASARVPAVVEFARGVRRGGTAATRVTPAPRRDRPPRPSWSIPVPEPKPPIPAWTPRATPVPLPSPLPAAPARPSWLFEAALRTVEMVIAAVLACALMTWSGRPVLRLVGVPATGSGPMSARLPGPVIVPLPGEAPARPRPTVTIRVRPHRRAHVPTHGR
jgi:hypothetical protein